MMAFCVLPWAGMEAECWPLVWQIRIYGGPDRLAGSLYKGTLTVVDDTRVLPRNTVLLRRSMLKLPSFASSQAGPHNPQGGACITLCPKLHVHVVASSELRSNAKLGTYLMYLLSHGGVQYDTLLNLVEIALTQVVQPSGSCLSSKGPTIADNSMFQIMAITEDRSKALLALQTYRPWDLTLFQILASRGSPTLLPASPCYYRV